MGRDNQPKDRQRRKIERKTGWRAPYDRILIVTEGSKTEPNYFTEIRTKYRLATANIEIINSEYGTLPQQIVDYAYDHCNQNNKWESVFCVFDEDDHLNFNNAITSAMAKDKKLKNDQGEKINFYAIPSLPCFELWLLLHFERITISIERYDVYKRLKKYIPVYDKGEGHFIKTESFLGTAFKNANEISKNRNGQYVKNPYTGVYEVVNVLMKLAESRYSI
jgi:hypothetical protein